MVDTGTVDSVDDFNFETFQIPSFVLCLSHVHDNGSAHIGEIDLALDILKLLLDRSPGLTHIDDILVLVDPFVPNLVDLASDHKLARLINLHWLESVLGTLEVGKPESLSLGHGKLQLFQFPAAGDVNGDGSVDIVIGNRLTNSLGYWSTDDHGATWTIYGVLDGNEMTHLYDRIDDGSEPGRAELRLSAKYDAPTGHVDMVPPFAVHCEWGMGERSVASTVRTNNPNSHDQTRFDLETGRTWTSQGLNLVPLLV